MKLSQISPEALPGLSETDIRTILYDGTIADTGESADAALLLGTRPPASAVRAQGAALLYNSGRVPCIVASGGVAWDYDGKILTEAEFMAEILEQNGVPQDAIILENEALTTKENMIYGTLQLNRKRKIKNVSSVCIVTSAEHMRRSLALAHLLLPRTVRICAAPATKPRMCFETQEEHDLALREVMLLRGLIGDRLMDDILF
ncbi:MAG: YdcF family protein [Ruminococcaceae bacterium]|nr:YdcF family protein [Oscillospiraceae bacterium]